MLHDILRSEIRYGQAIPLIALKAPKSVISSRWHALRAVNSLRSKVPLEQIAWDIVIIVDDGESSPRIFSTAQDIENSPQHIISALAGAHWRAIQLDW